MTDSTSPELPPDEEPTWLSVKLIMVLHDESLSTFGGAPGLREEALLERVLARPRHLHAYNDPTLAEIAASYCSGLVRNHPFVDGNKRAGLLAARAFLFQNSIRFDPEEAESVAVIRGLAAGEVREEELSAWIEEHAESQWRVAEP